MDRTLHVLLPDVFQADLVFQYKDARSGTVEITPYDLVESTDSEDNPISWLSRSSFVETENFSHGKLDSVAAIDAFDRAFVKKQFASTQSPAHKYCQYTYEDDFYPARYEVKRYENTVGIVDIRSDIAKNQKTLKYTSLRSLRDDQHPLVTDCMESDAVLLQRFTLYLQEEYMMGYGPINYKRVPF
jgi:hypothetical protein